MDTVCNHERKPEWLPSCIDCFIKYHHENFVKEVSKDIKRTKRSIDIDLGIIIFNIILLANFLININEYRFMDGICIMWVLIFLGFAFLSLCSDIKYHLKFKNLLKQAIDLHTKESNAFIG
jgi:hypothetical protein